MPRSESAMRLVESQVCEIASSMGCMMGNPVDTMHGAKHPKPWRVSY